MTSVEKIMNKLVSKESYGIVFILTSNDQLDIFKYDKLLHQFLVKKLKDLCFGISCKNSQYTLEFKIGNVVAYAKLNSFHVHQLLQDLSAEGIRVYSVNTRRSTC